MKGSGHNMENNNTTSVEEEKIEGIDDDSMSNWGDRPIDTVLIRMETRTAFDVIHRIKEDLL